MQKDEKTLTRNADATLLLMARALKAAESEHFRTGYLVNLPPAGELLVTGDLHGNIGNLQRIIEVAGLARHPQRYLVLQELVHDLTTVDELCRSYRVFETAAQLKAAFPDQVHLLLGNHEFSEVIDLEIGKSGRELNLSFAEGLQDAYDNRWEEVMEAYRALWRVSPLAVRTATRIFISHSTPNLERMDGLGLDYFRTATPEQVFQRNGPVFAMLWDRDYSPAAAEAFAQRVDAEVLIVGHTACENGFHVPNARHIILDSKDMDARFALLPLDRELNQRQVLAYVHRLYS
jgi:hypothetical protein